MTLAYRIHSIFSSIQGEGPFSGIPAIFVRFSGCNLNCPLCDTDHTPFEEFTLERTVGSILAAISEEQSKISLVVLTGGEPMLQDIAPLVRHLIGLKFFVQIETNGTLYRSFFPWKEIGTSLFVVCSPKTKIHLELNPYIGAYKYTVRATSPLADNGLPLFALGNDREIDHPPSTFRGGMIFIQPADEKNAKRNSANTARAVDICKRYGYTLCLQIHKIIGVA